MGGIGSGSQRRSEIACAEECHRLSIVQLRDAFAPAHRYDRYASAGLLDLEVNAGENGYLGHHTIRLWRGYRTGNNLFTPGPHVPADLWQSETSLFVPLTVTTPRYGGVRYWLTCPRCKKRCGVLYRPKDSNARAFACRKCYRLAYETQRVSKIDRLEWRLFRLLGRLIVTDDGILERPSGMHQRTFERLVAEIARLQKRCAAFREHQLNRMIRNVLRG